MMHTISHKRWLARAILLLSLIALAGASCSPTPHAGPAAPPATSGVTVYVGAQPPGQSASVYALQGSTGSTCWHVQTDGHVGVVTGWKVVPGTSVMYNLEVAQDHTFTVGVGQWVVHNSCFPNRFPERLTAELETANSLGVKPMKVGDPGFQEAIQNGPLKWAVGEDGTLQVIPRYVGDTEIAHTVITGGAPVQAAGEATIINTGNGYRITSFSNWSGHYQPDEISLIIGRNAFIDAGVQFRPPI